MAKLYKVLKDRKDADYPHLQFRMNYNNKLFARSFVEIRDWDGVLYRVGQRFRLFETHGTQDRSKWRFYGVVEIRKVELTSLGKLTEDQSYADTGYGLIEGRKIIKRRCAGVSQEQRLALLHLVKISLEELNAELKAEYEAREKDAEGRIIEMPYVFIEKK